MKKYAIYGLALAILFITGCQKEESFELGGAPGEGTLQSEASGDCLPKTVNGIYEAGVVLVPNVNTITVDINVTKTGTYAITTDTVNGYFFKGTGRFTTLGINTVTLRSQGTPFADGINNFVVSYAGQVCDIQVDVLPAGASGPAVFTLVNGGTPANCATAVVNGTYVKDVAVNSTNTVDVTVNVTTIGTYTITATGGGLTFTRTSAFTATGNQTVRLNATGTAPTVGPNVITFAAPFASCNFTVTVEAPAAFTIDCSGATFAGTYQAGTALTSSNTVTLPITVTTAGAYSITTTAVNGMTFSGNGTVTGASTSITLTGSGTPTAGGTFPVPVTFGATCSFDVVVIAAPTIDWRFTITGGATYQGSKSTTSFDNTTAPPSTALEFEGDNPAGDYFYLGLGDITGGILAGEIYKANATIFPPENGADFYFENLAGTVSFEATPIPVNNGTNLKVTITSHDPVAKIVIGTFDGTVKDQTGAIKNIAVGAGAFTIRY